MNLLDNSADAGNDRVARVSHRYAPGDDDIRLLTGSFRSYHCVPHAHAEYAVAAIERGVEAVRYRGATDYAPVGGLLLLDAETLHAGRPAVAEGWDYRVFYVPPAYLAEIAGGRPRFPDPTPHDPELARRLLALHRLLHDTNTLDAQERCHDVFAELLARYATHGGEQPEETGAAAMVARVREYLTADLLHTPSLDELAGVAGLPRFRFLRSFRNQTGLTPHTYLIQLRLRRAQALLTAGHTVAQAAADSGFYDQSHLHRHFARTFGAPPGRFARGRNRVQDRRVPAS